MTIYEITQDRLIPLDETSFAVQGIKERSDLQRLLRDRVDIIAPDTLVISEEFGEWEDSRRRIDLLAIDKDANIVVIELKRTEDGGHMELQALRYAAMVSTLTFARAVKVYSKYLEGLGSDLDPEQSILDFLQWEEPNEDGFGQDVHIVLASAEFSKELTTSVIWLNDRGLDIRCIRIKPYSNGTKLFLDVQQVIPLPEAEEYQIQIRDKARRERAARTQNRDFTKYDITVGTEKYERLAKRWTIFWVVKYLCDQGVDPDEIEDLIPWRSRFLQKIEGHLDANAFEKALAQKIESEGRKTETSRFFIEQDQLIYANDSTYALTKMWGSRTDEAINTILEKYPDFEVSCRVSES